MKQHVEFWHPIYMLLVNKPRSRSLNVNTTQQRRLCQQLLRIKLPLIAPVWFVVSRETRLTFYSKIVNMQNHDLISRITLYSNLWTYALHMKPRLTFYSNLWTCDATLWSSNFDYHFIQTCEHGTPHFDLQTSTNFLFKLVNMRHHTLIMKPWLTLT